MSPSTILLLVCAVALVVWITRQVRQFHHVPSPARPDRHLPESDYRLLGDDYREKVAPYFRGRVERDRRLADALDPCFAKNEGRDVSASGLPTNKESSLAGTEQ